MKKTERRVSDAWQKKKCPENDYTPVTYDPQYILMVNHLKKYFPIKGGLLSQTVGHVKAVDGVTFNLRRGCTMGLVGESGCGKSTTGRTILRLGGDKTGGQVLFNGKEVYDMTPAEMRNLRTKMQIIFQDPFSSLSPRLPVGEIIGEAVREHNLVPKANSTIILIRSWTTAACSPTTRPATRTSSPAASASVSALPVRWL